MAVISGSIAALATASKVLAGAMTKKAVIDGAKKFVKGKATNAVKNKVTGKGRKKKKGKGGEGGSGEPGAIVRSGSSDVSPSSPMFGGLVLPDPVEPKVKTVKPVGKVSFSSITNQLDSIVSLTASIESVTGKGIASKKKRAATARKDREKAKKREKENKREGVLAGVGGFLLNQGKKAGEGLGIFNFFTQLFLGFVALSLLKFARPIMSGIEFATKNLHLTFLAFKGLNETFKLLGPKVSGFFKDGLTKLKNFKPNIWGKIGKGIKNTFSALGKVLPGFITRGVEKIAEISKAIGNAAKAAGRAVTFNTRTQALGKTSGALNKLTSRAGASAGRNLGIGDGFRRLPGGSGRITNTLSKKTLQIRAQHGDEAARMYQQALDSGKTSKKALSNVNKAISSGKLTSVPMKGSLGGGIKGSQLFKGGANRSLNRGLIKTFGKNKATSFITKQGGLLATKSGMSRIPVIGPLIVAVTTYFEDADGDGQPDKKLDKALFKAGGTLLGGFLGTFIPIPIIGTILGELVGEYVGELFYILLRGGGISAVGNKLKQDVTALFQTGQKVLGWATDGFKRMYEGIPKFKIPQWVPGWMLGPLELLLNSGGMSLKDIEIPNPFWMANPFNFMEKAGVAMKAFFSRDSMTPGEVKDSTNEPEGPRDTSNDKNQKIDKNYGLKVGDEVTFTTSTGMKVKAHKTTNGFDFYKEGFLGMGGDKIDFADGKNSWIVDEFAQSQQSKNPDQPPAPTESSSTDQSGSPNMLGDRPGSDTAGLKAVAPSSSQSVTPYNASGGNKNRKMFLHWTAGGYNTPYSYYHTTFLGSGKAVRYTPYGKDKNSHTAGANSGSIGLSVAAMYEGKENATTWSTPPTSAQMDAMITEAAQIGLDWGWDASTVDKNVRTHGEWEREATSTGLLDGGPQRWDLDKLKPSDPNINVSRVLSHGGNTLRARIKAKMASLKGGADPEQKEEKGSPSPPPAATKVSPVDPSEEMKKPERSDYKGRSGAADYETALKKYEARKGTPVKAEVTPTETMTGQDVKPVDPPEMKKPERSDYTGRSGAADYEKDMKEYNSQQPKITPTDTPKVPGQTPEPSTPTITPQKAPTQNIGSVEKQASYENPGEGSPTIVPLPPPQQSSGGGGGGKSSTGSTGSGNLLNSYYEAQLLGSLYKVG
mgnify:CR=1 FL=1